MTDKYFHEKEINVDEGRKRQRNDKELQIVEKLYNSGKEKKSHIPVHHGKIDRNHDNMIVTLKLE